MSHSDALIRIMGFLGVFTTMAAWELFAPRRPLKISKTRRWIVNLGLVLLDTLLVRLLFVAGAVGVAIVATAHGSGVLHHWNGPTWLMVPLAVIALDLGLYLQHVLFHAVPGLWRLHMVHHADVDVDVTTGVRFHPVEVTLSMGIKMAVILLIGASPVAVLIFEVLLNATSMFNHSNVRIPVALDRALRWLIVTPDMHRVHHSILPWETNTNFGFNLPWWDRLLGTYRADPLKGHEEMTLGLKQFRNPAQQSFLGLLTLPLSRPGNYPLNRES